MTSPVSTCARCLDDYDTDELSAAMLCPKCEGLKNSEDLTNALLLVIDWLEDNNVHTLAKLLEWNAADLIETYTDRPVEYNDDLMLKGYKAAQLAIDGTR
jgi:hypothetical protein